MHSIIGTGECLRSEKWQQLASMECANKSMSLNSSIMTLDWCGLSEFRGIEFICCPNNKIDDSDYETSPEEQNSDNWVEDNPIQDSIPSSERKIIAMTIASSIKTNELIELFHNDSFLSIDEPSWMEDYRRWSTDPAYFAGNLISNCVLSIVYFFL